MNRVINISFPRSGHHMMLEVLRRYFGDDLKYCEYYTEFRKRPELCGETNFTKYHDHDLTWPVDFKYCDKYLVTVRHPLYSIASWRIHHRDELGDVVENQERSKQKVKLWADWVNKWVLSDIPNRMIVQYESMVRDPCAAFFKIIPFLSEEKMDFNKLSHSIDASAIRHIPNTTKDWIGWI